MSNNAPKAAQYTVLFRFTDRGGLFVGRGNWGHERTTYICMYKYVPMRYSKAEANAKATAKPSGGNTSRKQIKEQERRELNSGNANMLYTCYENDSIELYKV